MSSYLLILTISLSLTSTVLSIASWIDCGPSKSFMVELENKTRVIVHGGKIQLRYDRNELVAYGYPGLNAVNLALNNSVVTFSGYVVLEENNVLLVHNKTKFVFIPEIVGSARIKPMKNKSKDMVATDLKLLVKRNNHKENYVPNEVLYEIEAEAEACANAKLPEKIRVVTTADLQRGKNHPMEFGPLSVSNQVTKPPLNEEDFKTQLRQYKDLKDLPQSIVNMLVDLIISNFAQKIEKKNNGFVQIPDIDTNVPCTEMCTLPEFPHFFATNGTFGDLKTFKRVNDATKKEEGSKLILSFNLDLPKANIYYDKYKLRYGLMEVAGSIFARVDEVKMNAVLTIDSRQKCKVTLAKLEFTKFDKIMMQITSLEPVGKIISDLVKVFLEYSKGKIAESIENELETFFVENIKEIIPC